MYKRQLKDVPHKGGRILAADILAAASRGAAPEAQPREETKPMTGMRRAIARNMHNSHMTSPTVSFNLGCDVSELAKFRQRLKAEDIKVSYTDILVKLSLIHISGCHQGCEEGGEGCGVAQLPVRAR